MLPHCLILSLICSYVSALVQSGAIQITTHPEGTVAGQGLQTLTMTNANPSSGASATPGTATIVQYAQGPDGQFLIPGKVLSYILWYAVFMGKSTPYQR